MLDSAYSQAKHRSLGSDVFSCAAGPNVDV